MEKVTRRSLLGSASAVAAAALAAPRGPLRASPVPAKPRRPVDFQVDGYPFTPAEYAEVLRVAAERGVVPDEYSRGGEVEALEARFAGLLGKETAVFMPSGTLANQLAVRRLCGAKRRVLVQEQSHLYNDCGDCASELSQLTLVPLAPGKATFTWEEAAGALAAAASSRVAVEIGAISIESPVRRRHGEVFEFGEMQRVCGEARRRGIALHLDGARLFVASAYSGRAPAEYAALFDTVYVSLWKCFSSGGGAMLAGPKALLGDLYQARRMFGGALWNAWPYAAVAGRQSEGYLERLTAAVAVSEKLIALLSAHGRFEIERVPHGTSLFRVRPKTSNAPLWRERLAARGIAVGPPDEGAFWLKVNETLANVVPERLTEELVTALPPV